MGRIFADSTGKLLAWYWAADCDEVAPPAEAAESLEIDTSANHALCGAVYAEWDRYRLSAGVLYRDGAEVTVAPFGPAYTERRAALAVARALKQYLALPAPTVAQSQAALAGVIRLVLVLGRLALREVADE